MLPFPSWKLPRTNSSQRNSKMLWTLDSTASFRSAGSHWAEKTSKTALSTSEICIKMSFSTSSTSNPSRHASLWWLKARNQQEENQRQWEKTLKMEENTKLQTKAKN
jgi:hypothetical protein